MRWISEALSRGVPRILPVPSIAQVANRFRLPQGHVDEQVCTLLAWAGMPEPAVSDLSVAQKGATLEQAANLVRVAHDICALRARLGCRAEHAEGDRAEMCSVLLELVHRHLPPPVMIRRCGPS